MNVEILLTIIILVGAILLFATEVVAIDVTAMFVIAALVLTGILTPAEGLAGFSNTAVATVAAMFVLSSAVDKSGALHPVMTLLERLFRRNYWIGAGVMLASVSFFSAFINNTPVVALFIPVVISCCRNLKASPEKLLIPISYASLFGGVCTLVGTSTNILASEMAAKNGLAPFGMFEMTPLGLIFLSAGFLYLLFVGWPLLPGYKKGPTLEEKFHLGEYVTNVVLQSGAPSIGKTVKTSPLVTELGVEIIQVQRGNQRFFAPSEDFTLQEGDVLKVKGDVEQMRKLQKRNRVLVQPLPNQETLPKSGIGLALHEVVVLPESDLAGKRLSEIDFEAKFGNAVFLGVRGRKGLEHRLLSDWKLSAGDCLLLGSPKDQSELLHRKYPDLFVISHTDYTDFLRREALISASVIASVIIVATLEILPIVTASLLGCLVLIITRVITPEEAYRSISWKVIMLLAGSLSLGLALEKTGAARLMAEQIQALGDAVSPVIVLSAVYLFASLLTEVMSNNATVVLLAPIVIAMAESMGVSARPFLMAITFAASASFMTPIGYQTNTMVYAAGDYTFRDFFRVGTPLNLLFWILASLLIPVFFPF
ncbi:MAG: SLC13 family permease [Saprospiraceae bacterium]|nr:SLC13 family permease [Saprospiraceae bacterium]MDW8484219.1 SLC13 family permease [Saprospiraceae bacterium]